MQMLYKLLPSWISHLHKAIRCENFSLYAMIVCRLAWQCEFYTRPPWPLGWLKSQILIFSNKYVSCHFFYIRIWIQADMKYIRGDFSLKAWFWYPEWLSGVGWRQNSTLSEYGLVAYKIKENNTWSIIVQIISMQIHLAFETYSKDTIKIMKVVCSRFVCHLRLIQMITEH